MIFLPTAYLTCFNSHQTSLLLYSSCSSLLWVSLICFASHLGTLTFINSSCSKTYTQFFVKTSSKNLFLEWAHSIYLSTHTHAHTRTLASFLLLSKPDGEEGQRQLWTGTLSTWKNAYQGLSDFISDLKSPITLQILMDKVTDKHRWIKAI